MPTYGLFIQNMTSRSIVQIAVTSALVQPTIPSQLVSSFQLTLSIQLTVSGQVLVSSSIPPSSGQTMPPPGGQDPNIFLISREINVTGLQTHMVGMNQHFYGVILNPAGFFGSDNVQYQ